MTDLQNGRRAKRHSAQLYALDQENFICIPGRSFLVARETYNCYSFRIKREEFYRRFIHLVYILVIILVYFWHSHSLIWFHDVISLPGKIDKVHMPRIQFKLLGTGDCLSKGYLGINGYISFECRYCKCTAHSYNPLCLIPIKLDTFYLSIPIMYFFKRAHWPRS